MKFHINVSPLIILGVIDALSKLVNWLRTNISWPEVVSHPSLKASKYIGDWKTGLKLVAMRFAFKSNPLIEAGPFIKRLVELLQLLASVADKV